MQSPSAKSSTSLSLVSSFRALSHLDAESRGLRCTKGIMAVLSNDSLKENVYDSNLGSRTDSFKMVGNTSFH